MEKVRFGIVGCGGIHARHAEAIRDMNEIAELTAVCDRDPAKAAVWGEKWSVKAYNDYAELIADPNVDAVCICVPPAFHGELAITAMNAGKHVLTEKPIEIDLAKADAMIDAAKRNGVLLASISESRYGEGIKQLHRWLDDGRIGKLYYGEAAVRWFRPQSYYGTSWRGSRAVDGGGALINPGYHYVDQLRWAMGKPRSVRAHMTTIAHQMECEDVMTAIIEFENGALGSVTSMTCARPGFQMRLEVCGSEGSVRITNNEIESASFADGSEYTSTSANDAPAGGHSKENGHWLQLNDFTHAILDGREPEFSAEHGRNTLELILAVYESARTGKAVLF